MDDENSGSGECSADDFPNSITCKYVHETVKALELTNVGTLLIN
jgi:hypothetical protein